MKILVCIKRVPATDTRVKVGADGTSLDPSGVQYVLNPYCEFAVEEALRRVEAVGEGEVVCLTVGSQEAEKELRTCLAMGADRALRVPCDSAFALPPATVAQALAEVVRAEAPDLVLCGKQAVDRDNAQTGAYLATLLDWPCVTEAVALEIGTGTAHVEREADAGHEIFDIALPAVVTCAKGLNEPRYANLKGIMAAKKKPLETVEGALADSGVVVHAMELPPGRPAGRIVGEGADAVPALIEALQTEAKVL